MKCSFGFPTLFSDTDNMRGCFIVQCLVLYRSRCTIMPLEVVQIILLKVDTEQNFIKTTTSMLI